MWFRKSFEIICCEEGWWDFGERELMMRSTNNINFLESKHLQFRITVSYKIAQLYIEMGALLAKLVNYFIFVSINYINQLQV